MTYSPVAMANDLVTPRRSVGRPKLKGDYKQTSVRFRKHLHKEYKSLAVDAEGSFPLLVNEVLEAWLEDHADLSRDDLVGLLKARVVKAKSQKVEPELEERPRRHRRKKGA